MAEYTVQEIIKRYLQDAIAAENAFESQLRGFAKEGDDPVARDLFQQHAEETHDQIERLTSRLQDLGESPSGFKSFFAHVFNFAPKTATLGHDEAERTTQNLMIAHAVEHSEVGMYEALAVVAESVDDLVTAQLAREIQEEEEAFGHKVWDLIAPSARRALHKLTAQLTH